jgi:3-dehydroquinate synthase
MPEPSIVYVRAPGGKYSVICGSGSLKSAGKRIAAQRQRSGIFLLSSRRVWRHWGRAVNRSIPGAVREPILFDDREAAKNLSTVEGICRDLAKAGADRKSLVVAIGGGVVGDVAGFVAASYLRGVRLVHVPTTLVAQVDSAIGGKTGVNLPEGKNLVGAFYQPELVIADSDTLATLPAREFRSGIYEVIKYGVIGDAQLFAMLEQSIEKLVGRDKKVLAEIIPRCVAAKARVIARDERESGPREVLNFGHTFGHALESLTRYRVFLHGEAVGWGMIAAALLAITTQHLRAEAAARIIRLVRRTGPLPALPRVKPSVVLQAMRADKKTRGGRLRFVLPREIGRCELGVEVRDDLVTAVWNELSRASVPRLRGARG